MELLAGACALGLAYSFLSLGVYVTFRIFRFPDITVDGSFTLGAAALAASTAGGLPAAAALPLAALGGLLAGAATGLIHTRLRVGGLLAGILVMTALYSVNLRVMGRPNLPLIRPAAAAAQLPAADWQRLPFFLAAALAAWLFLAWLLRTDLGLAMRAAGSNPLMLAAQGGRAGWLSCLGVALANGLAALSGALVAAYQGFADVNMGLGMILLGLASVFLGEALCGRRSLSLSLLGVIAGTALFRVLVSLALASGVGPRDLKLLTAAFVLAALVCSRTARRLVADGLSAAREEGG